MCKTSISEFPGNLSYSHFFEFPGNRNVPYPRNKNTVRDSSSRRVDPRIERQKASLNTMNFIIIIPVAKVFVQNVCSVFSHLEVT